MWRLQISLLNSAYRTARTHVKTVSTQTTDGKFATTGTKCVAAKGENTQSILKVLKIITKAASKFYRLDDEDHFSSTRRKKATPKKRSILETATTRMGTLYQKNINRLCFYFEDFVSFFSVLT
eukprot:Selendium_serpulae@DN7336_c0_g1_i1.p1